MFSLSRSLYFISHAGLQSRSSLELRSSRARLSSRPKMFKQHSNKTKQNKNLTRIFKQRFIAVSSRAHSYSSALVAGCAAKACVLALRAASSGRQPARPRTLSSATRAAGTVPRAAGPPWYLTRIRAAGTFFRACRPTSRPSCSDLHP